MVRMNWTGERQQGNRGKTISIMQARSDVGVDHSEAARLEIQLFYSFSEE